MNPMSSLAVKAGCALLAALAGGVVGLASCAFWLALKLPMRVMDVFDGGSTVQCGWAILGGMTFAALMGGMGWMLPLGMWATLPLMLLGGMFVGMVASALTETLDVLPQGMDRMGLGENLHRLAWALALGKLSGALLAGWLHL